MQPIKKSNIKVNQYVKSNESEVSKNLSNLDYGKLSIGLVGLGICVPYLIPNIAGIQTVTLIPVIAKGLTTVATCALCGVVTHVGIDILKDSKKSSSKIDIKEEKTKVITNVNTSTNISPQGVKVNIDDSESKYSKDKEGVIIC